MEYKAFEPGIEVNGQTVFSVIDGFGSFRRVAEKLLVNAGVGTRDGLGMYRIALDGWYSQEAWLSTFKEIAKQVGQAVLYDIGVKIPANAKFPGWVVDVPSAVKSIDFAYHMNHRKGGVVMFDPETGKMLEGIGHYGFDYRPGQNTILSRCENPYPCSFDEGIVTAMARRFDPRARVQHDAGACRREGANYCVYKVEFG